MSRLRFYRQTARRLLALFLFAIATASVSAEELKLEAKLIWGTNDDKSPDPSHKPVDPGMAEKLKKVFKWKNYFIVTNQLKMVPSRGSNRFDPSKQGAIGI